MKKRYWLLLCGLMLFGISKLGDSPSNSNVATPSPSYPYNVTPTSQPKALDAEKSFETPIPKNVAPEPSLSNSRSNETAATKFISGNRIALRDAPNAKAGIKDRLDAGKKVSLLGQEGQWSRIRDSLTQKEGWIASRFLSDKLPQKERIAKPAETTVKSPPVISPSIIIQRIIAESLASYPGSCACPYSTDRGGRRCGNRSAYSKPGGYAPICFAGDVTKSMIEAYQ
ncbi:SH3 domain-containing protein [Agrobacterium sp. rho-13.3]|uniref:SH3 domain-containing protein n=1 Tax=Agrobacterium sp. rho-13.3 TaxID=3072980 RepID=UPI002A10FEC3|nr:SH3 domain-containing protein [Agrobacterium sp. rho-13.3]MDX8306207.1 SH3 domain-containing protein [Agrobacterium sp. rho-13.3]MDX8307462.1 SH3 domain-containing protein [Agrobacterium sp. rho-13.3]